METDKPQQLAQLRPTRAGHVAHRSNCPLDWRRRRDVRRIVVQGLRARPLLRSEGACPQRGSASRPLTLLPRLRSMRFDIADTLLALFLAWSAVSAIFATNHWLAQRALAVSLSSALIFWAARMAFVGRTATTAARLRGTRNRPRRAHVARPGIRLRVRLLHARPRSRRNTRQSQLHRSRSRNRVSCNCLVDDHGETVDRRACGLHWSCPSGGDARAVEIESRLARARRHTCRLSRAARRVAQIRRSKKDWRTSARIALTSALGGALAIALPNQLNWNSDSPYLDSAKKMVDYSSGSGRGRVAQYRNTLKMSAANPVLGVAPGNWPVKYVRYAPGGDKSLADNGMTANPWPSSDWMAFISERGFVGALLLLGVFTSLFFRSLRRWQDHPDGDTVLRCWPHHGRRPLW